MTTEADLDEAGAAVSSEFPDTEKMLWVVSWLGQSRVRDSKVITLLLFNGFSKFFHWHILQDICNKNITKDLTASKKRRYTTLWNNNAVNKGVLRALNQSCRVMDHERPDPLKYFIAKCFADYIIFVHAAKKHSA